LSIGMGVILLGSIASSTAIYELKILPEQKVEIAERQGSKALQDLVAKSGVVLIVDALRTMLGPAVSVNDNDIDVVTA